MTPTSRVILLGSVVVLAYAAATALAARTLGLSFGYAVFGSYLIYAAIGYVGARATGRISRGVVAGFAVGVVDATLGWLVSWLLGPARAEGAAAEPLAIAAVVAVVPLGAAAIAFFGALASRLLGRGGPRPA